jgi:hypothetical protein
VTRIGTWNLAGKWSEAHAGLLADLDCDVLLLTEVRRDIEVDSYQGHQTKADMAVGRAWAGIYSRAALEPGPDPHPASALAEVDGRTYCSSVLPWKGAWAVFPWSGDGHAAKTQATVDALREHLRPDVIWGGDFNHAMTGSEVAGSRKGRGHVHDLLRDLHLRVPTTHLAHRHPSLLSIDHIAVPGNADIGAVQRIDATGLSDHDAYVVTLELPE